MWSLLVSVIDCEDLLGQDSWNIQDWVNYGYCYDTLFMMTIRIKSLLLWFRAILLFNGVVSLFTFSVLNLDLSDWGLKLTIGGVFWRIHMSVLRVRWQYDKENRLYGKERWMFQGCLWSLRLSYRWRNHFGINRKGTSKTNTMDNSGCHEICMLMRKWLWQIIK